MNTKNTIRALKDPEFRASLTDAERAALESPIGVVELSDNDLGEVVGGATYLSWCRTVCGVYCTVTNQFDCLGS